MDVETNNFNCISLKKLVAFTFIIFIMGFLVSFLIPVEDAYRNEIFNTIVYTFILLWIIINLKKSNISLKCLLGPLPDIIWSRNLILISIFITLLSISIILTILYTLTYVSPNFISSVFNTSNSKGNTNTLILIYKYFFCISIVPLTEELIFRGILINKWGMKYGSKTAIIFSTLLFSILHGNKFIAPLILGYIVGILYIRTGRLLLTIICHSINNIMAGFSYILQIIGSGNSNTILYSIKSFRIYMKCGVVLFILLLPIAIYYISKYSIKNNMESPYYKIVRGSDNITYTNNH